MKYTHFFTFSGDFTSFNDYINAERRNKYVGAKIKKQQTQTMAIDMFNAKIKPIDYKVDFLYVIHANSLKRDPDSWNIWEKFFLDALQCHKIEIDKNHTLQIPKILPNDSQKYIGSRLFAPIQVCKAEPRIEVYIRKHNIFLINQFTL